jgi:phosphoserine phosphatase
MDGREVLLVSGAHEVQVKALADRLKANGVATLTLPAPGPSPAT